MFMKDRLLILGIVCFILASCETAENIQDGQTAYNLKKYALATELLQKDFAKAELPDEKGRIAFQIGESYEYNNNYKSAAEWYYKAADLNYGSDAILRYAYMLKAQEKYIDAIKEFEKYLNEEPYRRPEITIELNASKQALTWMSNQNDEYERDTYVTNLTALNSADADFNPVLYKQDQVLITSSRTASSGEKTDTWTNDKFYDLFISQIKDINTFTAPEKFEGPFNSEYNDGTPAFNKDFTEVYFTRCGSGDKKIDDYCGIYLSTALPNGGWSEPIALPFFEDTMNIGTPCLSPDGETLFFAATNLDGFGGSDIYTSKRNDAGWDAAVNAGQVVNTDGNEVFPYFDTEGNFYFSSDKQPGIGGLDLFSASWKNGKFSNIKNLEYPINSGADDFGLIMLNKNKFKNSDTLMAGYFSSNRTGGEGDDDIYQFVKTKKKLRPAVYVLNGMVKQKVYEDSMDVNSRVLDTIVLNKSIATLAYPDLLTLLGKFNIAEDGKFSVQVDSMKEYKITGMKDGFFNNTTFISTKNLRGKAGDTVQLYAEVVLDKIPVATAEKGGEIKLKNIYYDYNDSSLRAESFPELDKLVKLLSENPGINIQINSHTDTRGNDKYNEKLSRGRANSVVEYLIEKGIDKSRLSSKGFGESTPSTLTSEEVLPSAKTAPKGTVLNDAFINTFKSNKEDFEFLHQLNRRTTFNVTSATINIQSEDADTIEIDKAPDGVRDPDDKKVEF